MTALPPRAFALTAAVLMATALFSSVVFFLLNDIEILLPGWPVWRRYLATLGLGFALVGTAISMIFVGECLIAAALQRSFHPTVEPRVARYPTVASLCVALAGSLGLLFTKWG